jgi:hypothetical protein
VQHTALSTFPTPFSLSSPPARTQCSVDFSPHPLPCVCCCCRVWSPGSPTPLALQTVTLVLPGPEFDHLRWLVEGDDSVVLPLAGGGRGVAGWGVG